MLPLVLGGIALAAIGYGLKEYCEEEGCPWDEESSSSPTKTNTQNVWSAYKSTKKSLHDHELSQLALLLDKVKESKYTIDETLVFAEETYDGLWNGMFMHPLHMYHKDVADKQEKRKNKRDAQVSRCNDILINATCMTNTYIRKISSFLHEEAKFKSYMKSQKRVLKNAYKFLHYTQVLLTQELVDEDGIIIEDTQKAFLAYREILAKHKSKQFGHENYTLFLTGSGVVESRG